MFQANITYTDDEWLRHDLQQFARTVDMRGASKVLVNTMIDTVDPLFYERITRIVDEELPDAVGCGFSVNGLIGQGRLLHAHAQLVCMAFEKPDSRCEVLQVPATEDTLVQATASLVDDIKKRPWVKGVALYVSVQSINIEPMCCELGKLDPEIKVVGGGAQNRNIASDRGCVFSKGCGFLESGIVAVLLGGSDLHLVTPRVSGWRPLGKKLVSRCEGTAVRFLGERPAFDVYSHYLGIQNDSDFYDNALEFPLLFDDSGTRIARVPVAAHPDGSLSLAFPVHDGSEARISYGDPQAIRHELQLATDTLIEFQPQAIFLFDCASRRKFWGDEGCSAETRVFESVAPTAGGYLRGEFRRRDGRVYLNNLTIIALGLREGPRVDDGRSAETLTVLDGENDDARRSTVYRLANFVNVATGELERANRKLQRLAETDQMTLVLNRTAIEQRIGRLIGHREEEPGDLSLAMFDIDDYKLVNDRFGHSWGDELLRVLATLMRATVTAINPLASLGRWGGDEFMAVLPHSGLDDAVKVAESVRANFGRLEMGPIGSQTLSIGVVQVSPAEDAKAACKRVDKMLYYAKNHGKNRVCW